MNSTRVRELITPILYKVAVLLDSMSLSSFQIIRKIGYEVMYRVAYPNLSLAKTKFGFLIFVDPNSPLGSSILEKGIWEECVTNLLLRKLERGMVFVDIGANVGYYTILAANRVGSEGKVIAFEPEPKNYSILCRNIRSNNLENVTTERLAVSNNVGTEWLYIGPFNSGSHSFFRYEFGRRISVKTCSLDFYFSGLALKPDFIKIDTEGAELKVLQVMLSLVKNLRIEVVMEFNPRFITSHLGINPDRILSKLRAWGFSIYTIENNGDITLISKTCEIKNECIYCIK